MGAALGQRDQGIGEPCTVVVPLGLSSQQRLASLASRKVSSSTRKGRGRESSSPVLLLLMHGRSVRSRCWSQHSKAASGRSCCRLRCLLCEVQELSSHAVLLLPLGARAQVVGCNKPTLTKIGLALTHDLRRLRWLSAELRITGYR